MNRSIVRSAQATREKDLKEAAEERLAPMLEQAAQTDDWSQIATMAREGTPQEREAAIAQMIKSRRWGELSAYRTTMGADTADWSRTLAKNGDLVETVSNSRADIMAGPSRPIVRVIAGGDIDLATGVARPGLTPVQLVQQHATFWNAAGGAIGGASDAEVQGAYERMQLMARDPRALQIVGGAGEAGANQIINEYNTRFGGGAADLRGLIAAAVPPAPPVVP